MTQTLDQPQSANGNSERLPALSGPRLPYHPAIEERFGIDKASWKALVEAIFPNASSVESVILALSYCRARKLDPFKRVVHIVPIWNRDLGRMVDTVWPGIGELRTTAFRTGEYAGRDASAFGPDVAKRIGNSDVTFPEWGQVTVYRIVKGQRVAFAGPRVYWEETYATRSRNDESPNEMWSTRPRGQLDKCAEAAALRAAFPEEVGSDYIPEETQHLPKHVDSRDVTGEDRPRGAAGVLAQIESRSHSDEFSQSDPPAAPPPPVQPAGSASHGQPSAGPGESDAQDAPSPDDDQRQPEIPPIPANGEALVDVVASLCGIEMNEAARRIKLTSVKPWDKCTGETKAAWWRRFLSGEVKDLKPTVANG